MGTKYVGRCNWLQRLSCHPDSIVVFAPHPDDEVIGCAGIIMQALARGARVKVVAITSGDGFPAAAAGVTHKKVNQVGPDDFLALSRFRQIQSRTALGMLGGKADDLIVLGYPDVDLGNLYESADGKVIRQQFPLVLHRTYLLNRGQLTAKWLRTVCPGRRRNASRLRESRRSENSNRSKPITNRFWECGSTRVRWNRS